MTKRKKPKKTVDDIISGYQKYHHRAGKNFKERIKKVEEFLDPDNIHALQFAHHAHYTVFGKPKDESFPGAFNEAYLVLDKHVEEDNDKLDDENKLAEILETYVDTFLQKAMGSKFKEAVAHAEEQGMKGKELRDLKGQLMSWYYTDEKGNPINILAEGNIKGLKGRKKIELIEHLKGLSENVKKSYTNYLHQKTLEGLTSEEDRLDLAKYITPIFKERGLEHKNPHITRSAAEQTAHYRLLLQGAMEMLIKEAGYKPLKVKKEEKK